MEVVVKKHFITVILLLCSTFLYTNLFAQEEKAIIWNPMDKSFINSSLINSANDPYQKTAGDSAWQSIGPDSNDILAIDFGDNSADIIYAASRYNGVFKTTNGGLDWFNTNNGISDNFIRSIATHPQNSSIVLAGTFNEGLFRSTDAGLTWNAVSEVNDSTILAITFDHFHGDTVYVGTFSNGVYSSFDGGLTWRQTTSDFTLALEVIIDPQFTNIIYSINPNEYRVYKSSDYGNSWEVFFEGAQFLSLSIDPYNSNIIYMGTFDLLYKSTDGGENWGIFPINGIIEDILIDDNNSNNIYLAIVLYGVFKSNDAGLTWEPLNNGLTALQVLNLKFHPLTTSTLYAATNNGAIFKIENIVTGINESNNNISNDFLLFQNYPNPFNPTTNIQYTTKQTGFVTLKVYNTLGKEVSTLVNEVKQPGSHKIEFNGSNLSSGIYFYKLYSGGHTLVKKMLLLK